LNVEVDNETVADTVKQIGGSNTLFERPPSAAVSVSGSSLQVVVIPEFEIELT
jgi:hypothetical protein